MGDPFVGLVHPCKAYNLLQINSPILYVGPKPSHITRILDELNGVLLCGSARHGEAEQVIKAILDLELQIAERPRARQDSTLLEGRFTAKTLLPRMVEAVESTNSNRLTP
jgi:hypothetical protein